MRPGKEAPQHRLRCTASVPGHGPVSRYWLEAEQQESMIGAVGGALPSGKASWFEGSDPGSASMIVAPRQAV